MNGEKKGLFRHFIKPIKAALAAFFVAGMAVCFISCADLQEEFEPSQWQYRPVPDMPPSWENDTGRPPFGGEGETPFND